MADTTKMIPPNELPDRAFLDSVPSFSDGDPTGWIAGRQPLVFGSQALLQNLEQLGGYRLLRLLGSGGMGIVFEAEDTATGEHFAVKVLRPTLVMEPAAKLRFFREARAMATIGHQRIVPIVRVGEERGLPFIVMPLLHGETLEDRLQRDLTLPLHEIVRIGIEIAEGLAAAHQQGLIHRDVKPANVWLEAPGDSVRLLDLGLAREINRDSLITNNGMVMGTPAYMSPEQASDGTLDHRSDLFSLGSILYEMATGERPFEGATPVIVLSHLETHHPPRVRVKNRAIPTLLSNLIMELLAKRPKDRPPSASSVIDRLRRIPLNEEPYLPASAFILRVIDDRSESLTAANARPEPSAGFEGSRLPLLLAMLLAIVGVIWYAILR